MGKDDIPARLQEIVVERQSGGVIPKTGREIPIACGHAHDAADETEAVGRDTRLEGQIPVLI